MNAPKKRRRRKKTRRNSGPSLALTFFILVPTVVLGAIHVVTYDNGITSSNDANTYLQQPNDNATVINNGLLDLSTADIEIDALNQIVAELTDTEIILAYESQSFTHTFADFFKSIDENRQISFCNDLVQDALININNQIHTSNININASAIMIMDILNGNTDNDVVILPIDLFDTPFANMELLGSFYTLFNMGDTETGRIANIRRAAYFVNNTTLAPGQSFSMNQTIGPVALDNDYHIALVIANGEFVEGIGGGVCQVSTTLYMAVLFAELEILQRRAHSRMVGYVPPAFDSVLATPYLDLRFENNTGSNIILEARTAYNRLTVNVWGTETRSPGRTLEFESIRAAENSNYITYHLYKIENYNGTLTRTRQNISTYRAEQEGIITYYEAISNE